MNRSGSYGALFQMDDLAFSYNNNNNNNNCFLYSALPVCNTAQSALQIIITPVIGFINIPALMMCTSSTPWGACWPGAIFRHSQCQINQQISFASYRVPIYTPGSRAAMWIKCLAEGQNCRVVTGIEPGTRWSRVQRTIHYTTAPRLVPKMHCDPKICGTTSILYQPSPFPLPFLLAAHQLSQDILWSMTANAMPLTKYAR